MMLIHYSDVLSAVDGRLVSFDQMEGVYRIFDAVAGPGVTTLAIYYLSEPVKQFLLTRYPDLGSNSIKEAIDKAIAESPQLGIPEAMERHVRPLVDEYYEVEHIPEEQSEQLMQGYSAFLDEKLKDKQKILVVVPEVTEK